MLEKLQLKYAELLNLRHQRIRGDLNLRVRTLQKRVEDIFELLALWQHYVEIIYMPEWELEWVKMNMTQDPRAEEASLSYRMEKQEIEDRLNLLFGPEEKAPKTKEEPTARSLNKEEELTTDTDICDQGGMKPVRDSQISLEMREAITKDGQ